MFTTLVCPLASEVLLLVFRLIPTKALNPRLLALLARLKRTLGSKCRFLLQPTFLRLSQTNH
jgi:hypothetical protein